MWTITCRVIHSLEDFVLQCSHQLTNLTGYLIIAENKIAKNSAHYNNMGIAMLECHRGTGITLGITTLDGRSGSVLDAINGLADQAPIKISGSRVRPDGQGVWVMFEYLDICFKFLPVVHVLCGRPFKNLKSALEVLLS